MPFNSDAVSQPNGKDTQNSSIMYDFDGNTINQEDEKYLFDMLPNKEEQLQPTTPPEARQSDPKTTDEEQCQTDGEMPPQSNYDTDRGDIDFSILDNPGTPPDDVRELPIWGLPNELQSVIGEVQCGYQCNRDFAVASMFAAAATMLGKRVSYTFDSYDNFPCLWIAIVGNSASGKTAPISFFFKPIELMERDAFKEYRREVQQWEQQDPKEREAKPEYHHHLINNPTDESVLYELSVNGSCCWKADELRTIFDNWGKYAKGGGGAIVGNLLSIFSNQDVSITRATSEPKYLEDPNLNIVGGTQPSILKKTMGGNKGFLDDGLFQRFLYVFPDVTDVPQYSGVQICDYVRTVWNDTCKRLADVSGEITETPEAKELHIQTINRWRDHCNSQYKDIPAMSSLLRKLEIHLCRWCIVAAVLSGSKTITHDIMKYSIECMDYFRLCGEKAFCLIVGDEQPKEPTKGEVFKLLRKWYGDFNQSKMAEALNITQQAVNKLLK